MAATRQAAAIAARGAHAVRLACASRWYHATTAPRVLLADMPVRRGIATWASASSTGDDDGGRAFHAAAGVAVALAAAAAGATCGGGRVDAEAPAAAAAEGGSGSASSAALVRELRRRLTAVRGAAGAPESAATARAWQGDRTGMADIPPPAVRVIEREGRGALPAIELRMWLGYGDATLTPTASTKTVPAGTTGTATGEVTRKACLQAAAAGVAAAVADLVVEAIPGAALARPRGPAGEAAAVAVLNTLDTILFPAPLPSSPRGPDPTTAADPTAATATSSNGAVVTVTVPSGSVEVDASLWPCVTVTWQPAGVATPAAAAAADVDAVARLFHTALELRRLLLLLRDRLLLQPAYYPWASALAHTPTLATVLLANLPVSTPASVRSCCEQLAALDAAAFGNGSTRASITEHLLSARIGAAVVASLSPAMAALLGIKADTLTPDAGLPADAFGAGDRIGAAAGIRAPADAAPSSYTTGAAVSALAPLNPPLAADVADAPLSHASLQLLRLFRAVAVADAVALRAPLQPDCRHGVGALAAPRPAAAPGAAATTSSATAAALADLAARGVACYSRESLAATPLTWDDLAGYDSVRKAVEDNVLLPMQHPDVYAALRAGTRVRQEAPPGGTYLFYGPPGTGKTSAARIIAAATSKPLVVLNFENIGSPYYSQSETALAEVLAAVDKLDGAILFLDEADAMFPSRRAVRNSTVSDSVGTKLHAQLLKYVEGMDGASRTTVIMSTNTPGALDPALLSRCAGAVEFPLPTAPQRAAIWARYTRHLPSADVARLAAATDGFSGRDIKRVCDWVERAHAAATLRASGSAGGGAPAAAAAAAAAPSAPTPDMPLLPTVQEYLTGVAEREEGVLSLLDPRALDTRPRRPRIYDGTRRL